MGKKPRIIKSKIKKRMFKNKKKIQNKKKFNFKVKSKSSNYIKYPIENDELISYKYSYK